MAATEKPKYLISRCGGIPCLRCGELIEPGTAMFPGGVRVLPLPVQTPAPPCPPMPPHAAHAWLPASAAGGQRGPPSRHPQHSHLHPPPRRVQGEEGTRYAHLDCAVKWCRDNGRPLVPPVCKHWRARGFCSFGARCFYSHPESCAQELARAAAQRWGPRRAADRPAPRRARAAGGRAAGQRALRRRLPPPRAGRRPGGRAARAAGTAGLTGATSSRTTGGRRSCAGAPLRPCLGQPPSRPVAPAATAAQPSPASPPTLAPHPAGSSSTRSAGSCWPAAAACWTWRAGTAHCPSSCSTSTASPPRWWSRGRSRQTGTGGALWWAGAGGALREHRAQGGKRAGRGAAGEGEEGWGWGVVNLLLKANDRPAVQPTQGGVGGCKSGQAPGLCGEPPLPSCQPPPRPPPTSARGHRPLRPACWRSTPLARRAAYTTRAPCSRTTTGTWRWRRCCSAAAPTQRTAACS
jgi:hypothetical protein